VGYDGYKDSDYQYGSVVESAQDAVRNTAQTECGGGSNTQGLSCNNLDMVTDGATYLAKVVAAIGAQGGFSGHVNGEDEVGIKGGENRDEHYDIILGSGGVRTGGNIAVCKPADF
jgi:hypothetical protein